MDTESASAKRTEISKEAWEDTASRLIKQYRKEPLLRVIHINTNLGLHGSNFGVIDEYIQQAHSEIVQIMTCFVRRTRSSKIVFGLEQRLPGSIQEDAYIVKKPGFDYRWYKNKEGISIVRFLGTSNPQTIKKQSKILLKESATFYFSNCISTEDLTEYINSKNSPEDVMF